MTMFDDVNGKVCAVTGAGGVLCGKMAKQLAANGAIVAVLDLQPDKAEAVAQEIRKDGGKAFGYACNVLEKDELERVNEKIIQECGTVDVLVNGAGGNHPKGTTTNPFLQVEDLLQKNKDIVTFYDLDPAGIQFVFNLNFLGTLLPTQAFTKGMVEKKSGVIVNVSSMNAFTPLTKIPAYSGAKAAISNFTQWLAVHFSKVGVRVNAIAPGFFLTAQNSALLTQKNGELTPRGSTIVNQTPMGRFGQADELLGTLMWLVSDKASGFVTGTVIPVDGGFSAYSGV